MGCTASKLDNEDTVRRCKERRRLMKDAVYARHHLAAAHFDYCRSLRITGSALTTFASGEPLSVSDQTPAVLLRTPSSLSTTTTILPPSTSLNPPPPHFSPSPSPPTISTPKPPPPSRRHHHKKPMKVPHILSESSLPSSPNSHNNPSRSKNYNYAPNYANSNYSATPSQESSVWNWENFYPPSPPGSEFFQQRNNNHETASIHSSKYHNLPRKNHHEADNDSSVHSNYRKEHLNSPYYSDFFQQNNNETDNVSVHSSYRNQRHNHHIGVDDVEEEEEEETEEREEVQYSEWDDHYNTTTSSSDEDRDSRSEIGTRSDFGSSVHTESKAPEANKYSTMSKASKSDDAGSTAGDMKMVVRHRDLAEIVAAIKEYFDKAASAGEQVSEMLEIGRAQMDRSFSQLKKTVYHSSGVLSNLSSSWTSKPPLAVKYRFEPGSIDEPGGSKSLLSTLERLLAWEKKLYQEVKAREGAKIELEKKLSSLQSQECRGGDEAKLDKTKTSIKRLRSLMEVMSQAVSTTSSSITGLRDAELVLQLVELCHGFMYMWRSMNQFHEVQNHIVQQVRGLVNRSTKGESTSDLHRQATRDLESAVSAWHSSFCRLIKFQRDFIRALQGWFKLTLLPVNPEPTNANREPSSVVFAFCDEWKLSLDRLPDTVASEAIKSFINVVHSISTKQTEELKIKRRTESASKELEKKASALRSIERKYYNSYSTVGIGLPDTGPDNGHALDARDPLSEKKSELAACQRRVEDEMMRHAKAIEVTRAMTLNNLQTGLPGVFQAMTSFSGLIMEALETVCTRSYAIDKH